MDPITVSLRGFDQRSAARLKNIFLVNYRGKCVVGAPEVATVFIVDLDGIDEADKEQLRAPAHAATILLSEQPPGSDDFQSLQKPVRLDQLWQAISQAASVQTDSLVTARIETTAQSVQKRFAPAATADDLRKVGKATRYNPDEYFVSRLLAALTEHPEARVIDITTWDLKRILICRNSNRIFSDIGKNQFRTLAATPLAKNLADSMSIHYHDTEPATEEVDGLREMKLERTLWELAWATSRGRLPEELDLSQKYYLSRWPNFTRLPAMNNGMRIAALWMGEPQRLDDIANRLGVEVEEVYAFHAAASALNLTGVAKRQSDHLIEQRAAIPESPRQLLRSLLGHIGSLLKPRNNLDSSYWSTTTERQT